MEEYCIENIICNYSYEVPEIIQIPMQNELESYLSWIDESTKWTSW